MGQNSIISSFFARRAKKASAEGRSPPQELEVGPRSGPYLLVADKMEVVWNCDLIKGQVEEGSMVERRNKPHQNQL